ncbi:MAG: CHY zinc finger protein [Phenylobacterium sp.]
MTEAIRRRPAVHGQSLDAHTGCAHWRSELDIIALKMRCCLTYYACRQCHDELAGHPAAVWPTAEWDEAAVLCGACGHELSVRQYLACDSRCPACRARFNPGCQTHKHLYFATEDAQA